MEDLLDFQRLEARVASPGADDDGYDKHAHVSEHCDHPLMLSVKPMDSNSIPVNQASHAKASKALTWAQRPERIVV